MKPDLVCHIFSFRHLFDVAQYSPVHSAKHMQQIVKDVHKTFIDNRDRQGENGFKLCLRVYFYDFQ